MSIPRRRVFIAIMTYHNLLLSSLMTQIFNKIYSSILHSFYKYTLLQNTLNVKIKVGYELCFLER